MKIFISHSHKNRAWLGPLKEQLDALGGEVDPWSDERIGAGNEWLPAIEAAMAEANAAILLVTAAFLNSPFIRKREVPTLLQRCEDDGLKVYPLIIEACPWQLPIHGWLNRMEVRPKDG